MFCDVMHEVGDGEAGVGQVPFRRGCAWIDTGSEIAVQRGNELGCKLCEVAADEWAEFVGGSVGFQDRFDLVDEAVIAFDESF